MSSQKQQGQEADDHEAGPSSGHAGTKLDIVPTAIRDSDGNVVSAFWHRGVKAGILENLASDTKEVAFDVHVGVVPLDHNPAKPNFQSWIIQGRLHEGTKPPGDPFVVAVFAGDGKPSREQFLGPVINEARQLCESSLMVNGRSINLKFRGILTSPATRAFVSGIEPLCGTDGCTDCGLCVKCGETFRCDNMTSSPPTTADRTGRRHFVPNEGCCAKSPSAGNKSNAKGGASHRDTEATSPRRKP